MDTLEEYRLCGTEELQRNDGVGLAEGTVMLGQQKKGEGSKAHG